MQIISLAIHDPPLSSQVRRLVETDAGLANHGGVVFSGDAVLAPSPWQRLILSTPYISDIDRELLLRLSEGSVVTGLCLFCGSFIVVVYGWACHADYYCSMWSASVMMIIVGSVLLCPLACCAIMTGGYCQ